MVPSVSRGNVVMLHGDFSNFQTNVVAWPAEHESQRAVDHVADDKALATVPGRGTQGIIAILIGL